MSPGRPEPTAFLGAKGGQNEHVGGRGIGAGAGRPDQVPAVRGTERPRYLELAEAEQRGDRPEASPSGYCPAVLIAYLLGEIGTIGSLIWLMWLISCVHCFGWRTLATSAESFLFSP